MVSAESGASVDAAAADRRLVEIRAQAAMLVEAVEDRAAQARVSLHGLAHRRSFTLLNMVNGCRSDLYRPEPFVAYNDVCAD